MISGFCWYFEFPNPTKFEQVIRYFSLFKTMKDYEWNVCVLLDRDLSAWIKNLKKTDPYVLLKNRGLFSLTFSAEHSSGLKLWSDGAWIFHAWYFHNFGPLKSKHLGKNYMVITLLGCLTMLALKSSKKLNSCLK